MFNIQIVGHARFVPGYLQDFRQPVLMLQVVVSGGATGEAFARQIQTLDASCGVADSGEIRPSAEFLLNRLLAWTTGLLEKSNHPVCQPGRVRLVDKARNGWLIVQPCIHPGATNRTLVGLINIVTGRAADKDETLAGISRFLDSTRLKGFNQFHFIKTAHELKIPWELLPGGLVLLGWGSNSRWLESSITDRTPSIATQYARHKSLAASLLRHAGIPVPEHVLVKAEDKLQEAVERIGYPLVVKPVDRDGGQGVKANLMTYEQALRAFRDIKQMGADVLVERHVPGRDYRVQVVEDVVHGVLERSPGGVVGNGIDTVEALVLHQNQERHTATDDRRYLHAITLDDEADEQLRAQNLDRQSVPAPGLFIRLRGACNVAGGGVPKEIPLDQVHPDNLLLARNTARALRLDVAGIDLLIPDIGQSWLETGAHICEVNAQPQMFTTMHGPMLTKILDGDGRIPVIAVITAGHLTPPWVERLTHDLAEAGICLGTAAPDAVRVGTMPVAKPAPHLFAAVKMLCVNTRVDAMLMVISGDQLQMQSGWPVDRCDYLIIDDGDVGPAGRTDLFRLSIGGARALGPKLIVSGSEADAVAVAAPCRFHLCQTGGVAEEEILSLLLSSLRADVGVP